jgi:hypothetical protein
MKDKRKREKEGRDGGREKEKLGREGSKEGRKEGEEMLSASSGGSHL